MKRKNEMADSERITREEYTLDCSQSKVFLVNTMRTRWNITGTVL